MNCVMKIHLKCIRIFTVVTWSCLMNMDALKSTILLMKSLIILQMRYRYYVLRKKHQLSSLQKLLKLLEIKVVLQQVMDDELVVYRKDYDNIVSEMEALNDKDDKNTYDYLLNMNIRSFTRKD